MSFCRSAIVILFTLAGAVFAAEDEPEVSANDVADAAKETKIVHDDGWLYLRMNTFQASVEAFRDVPLNPNEVHYSGAANGLEIDLRIDNRIFRISRASTDVNWRWTRYLRKLEIGKTYEFNADKKIAPKLMN